MKLTSFDGAALAVVAILALYCLWALSPAAAFALLRLWGLSFVLSFLALLENARRGIVRAAKGFDRRDDLKLAARAAIISLLLSCFGMLVIGFASDKIA